MPVEIFQGSFCILYQFSEPVLFDSERVELFSKVITLFLYIVDCFSDFLGVDEFVFRHCSLRHILGSWFLRF